jgi:hypothetical protein
MTYARREMTQFELRDDAIVPIRWGGATSTLTG